MTSRQRTPCLFQGGGIDRAVQRQAELVVAGAAVGSRSPAGTAGLVEAPEIVEGNLRPRQRLQLPGALGVEMAQHPPADTVVRYRSQLFLDAPERKSGCGAAGRDLGAIGLTRIE